MISSESSVLDNAVAEVLRVSMTFAHSRTAHVVAYRPDTREVFRKVYVTARPRSPPLTHQCKSLEDTGSRARYHNCFEGDWYITSYLRVILC